jgi:hypothetical protein
MLKWLNNLNLFSGWARPKRSAYFIVYWRAKDAIQRSAPFADLDEAEFFSKHLNSTGIFAFVV